MQLSDQTLAEFAILSLAGIVMLAVMALLVADYRRLLTRYTHRCWLTYQRPWYQRIFLWTAASRARYGDEGRLRRTFRGVAVLGLAMGGFVLALEFIALATGHVI
jgi:hypothetical protein